MNLSLFNRLEELEERIQLNEYRIHELEQATASMVDERIEEATSGLVTLEEVRHLFNLD